MRAQDESFSPSEVETRKARVGAMTLTELIIVIGVIAVLAAILLPVFATVRENARRTTCASNMRQLGMGLLQYAQDNDETLPNNTLHGLWALNIGWAGRLYPYTKSVTVFHCQDDPTDARADSTGNLAFPVSYGLNKNFAQRPHLASSTASAQTVLLFEVTGSRAEIKLPNENETHLNSSDYLSASANGINSSLFATANYNSTSAGPILMATGLMDNYQATPDIRVDDYKGQPARHRNGSNFTALDGHVAFLPGSSLSSGYNALTPSGAQAHDGCLTPNGRHHVLPCAEGTAVGTHRLTFSAN